MKQSHHVGSKVPAFVLRVGAALKAGYEMSKDSLEIIICLWQRYG